MQVTVAATASSLAVTAAAHNSQFSILHSQFLNTPPTPSSPHPLRDFPHKGKKEVEHSEGSVERRSAVRRYTGSHLIIFNFQFSILNSKEGRAERRSAVCGNTGSHLIIFNSQFSILNSKEGRAGRRSAVRGNGGRHFIIHNSSFLTLNSPRISPCSFFS
jgi:hypothetical protein